MPTVVNIAGTTPVDDPSYRYKMPLVCGKVEGRGNGIKTVIPNISEVSLSLHRDAGEVNKFFGCELGAQTTFNVKTDRAVVNGSHTDAALQAMIHKYVESFVLCPQCGLPETRYKIRIGCIYHNCAACGAVEMVDMEHKLCTYILAQDKKKKKEKKKEKKEKEKAEGVTGKDDASGKKIKKSKKTSKDKDGDDGKPKKKKKNKKRKKDKKDKEVKVDDYSDDEKKLSDDADDLSVDSNVGVDDTGAIELAVDGVRDFMKAKPNAGADEVAEVVVNQQMSSAVKSHDKVQILIRAIITPSFFKEKQIEKYAPYIEKVTLGNPIMERYLISAIEYICVDKPKNFPVMLKQLYDEDALQEDIILAWAFDGRSVYTAEAVDEDKRSALRAEAEPFITWLQDEDGSSGSSSD